MTKPFSEVSIILSSLGFSLSDKEVKLYIGYTATLNKFLLVTCLLSVLYLQSFPTKITCDSVSNLDRDQTSAKCKQSLSFYKFGEQLTEPAKTKITIAEPKKVQPVRVFEDLADWLIYAVIIILCAPKYLWKTSGGRYIEDNLLVHVGHLSVKEFQDMEAQGKIADFLRRSIKSLKKKYYCIILYYFCQLVMMISMWIPYILHNHIFYDIEMESAFLKIFTLKVEYRLDALQSYFPTKVACLFTQYGYSGTMEVISTVCSIGNNNYMQMLTVVLYYLSLVCAVIATIDFVLQLLLLWIPAYDFESKVIGFYLYMIKMNYNVVVTEDMLSEPEFYQFMKRKDDHIE